MLPPGAMCKVNVTLNGKICIRKKCLKTELNVKFTIVHNLCYLLIYIFSMYTLSCIVQKSPMLMCCEFAPIIEKFSAWST